MSDVKLSVGLGDAIGNVLSAIFTGGPADAVIAVLLLVCIFLGYAVFKLSRKIDSKDKLIQELADQYNGELRSLTNKFLESVDSMSQRQSEETRLTNSSIQATQVILTEIKTLLNAVLIHQPNRIKTEK